MIAVKITPPESIKVALDKTKISDCGVFMMWGSSPKTSEPDPSLANLYFCTSAKQTDYIRANELQRQKR